MKNFKLMRAAFAVSVSVALAGCGGSGNSGKVDPDEPATKPAITVNPTILTLAASGEAKSMEVNAENISWIVTASASWLHVTPSEGATSAVVSISADENTSTKERTASVTFSGTGVSNVKVNVTQEAAKPKDVDLKINVAEAYYMGDNFETDRKFATVVLAMSDANVTSSGLSYPCDVAQIPLVVKYTSYKNLDFTGTYKVVQESKPTAENTVPGPRTTLSHYVSADAVTASYKPASGEVKVVSKGLGYEVSFDFVLENGASYKGTFSGQLTMIDNTIQSTLRNDVTPAQATRASAYFQDYNDKLALLTVDLVGRNSAGNYDDMMMMFFVDKSVQTSKNIVGTYKIDADYQDKDDKDLIAGSAIPGFSTKGSGANEYNYAGVWYLETDVTGNNVVGNRAPAVSGTITVARGLGYTVTYDLVDDAGNKITGTYTGDITFQQ